MTLVLIRSDVPLATTQLQQQYINHPKMKNYKKAEYCHTFYYLNGMMVLLGSSPPAPKFFSAYTKEEVACYKGTYQKLLVLMREWSREEKCTSCNYFVKTPQILLLKSQLEDAIKEPYHYHKDIDNMRFIQFTFAFYKKFFRIARNLHNQKSCGGQAEALFNIQPEARVPDLNKLLLKLNVSHLQEAANRQFQQGLELMDLEISEQEE